VDPDFPVVMIIFPVKVKWLARFYLLLLVLMFLGGSLPLRMGIIATFSNYLIFFGLDIWRNAGHRMEAAQRRQRFIREAAPASDTMHQCTVCHRTEISNPELDFRVSADGNEYCVEHLPSKAAQ
jgi:hypothetical protein